MIVQVNDLLKINLTDKTIAFQTDTVYGVGTQLNSKKGVQKIYELKRREASKPLPVLCPSIEVAMTLVKDPKKLKKFAERYWPGAVTLVIKKSDLVPNYVTKNADTVGLRIPNDPLALMILNHVGPMAVTSLNYSSEPAILNYSDAVKFEPYVDILVEGSDLSSVSSTVYDIENKKVLRQGKTIIKDLK